MGARAAAGSPRLDTRRLLDYVCDIAVAVPSLAPVLACSVLPRLAVLARLADRGGAARSSGQPILEKVLGAFAQAMPEVRALEALHCCMLPAPGLHEEIRGCSRNRGFRHTELPGVRLCVYLGRMWSSVTAMPIRHALASQHDVPSWQSVTSRIASCAVALAGLHVVVCNRKQHPSRKRQRTCAEHASQVSIVHTGGRPLGSAVELDMIPAYPLPEVKPHLPTWCKRASSVSGARQVALALREALGLDAGLPHAALLRALRCASAQSHPAEWGEELCARVSIRDALMLAAAAQPKSAKAAARALEARRLSGPIFGCCHAGCSNFEHADELLLAQACQLCSGCLVARYCSTACQRAAWDAHRAFCKASRTHM